MNRKQPAILLFLLTGFTPVVTAQSVAAAAGMEIMEQVHRRHFLDKSIYEEISVILTDRNGNRDTRHLRRYSRTDGKGKLKYLLVLDTPADVHGAALLASRNITDPLQIEIYLPAHGRSVTYLQRREVDHGIFGMDVSFEDLIGEVLSDYRYIRLADSKIENVEHFVIDVYRDDADLKSAHPVKRHFVRKDGRYIVRTEYFDPGGRLLKQQTSYDISRHDGNLWGAAMILVENFRKQHSTLIKINRRIVSDDYVPEEVFTLQWLQQNHPPPDSGPTGDTDSTPADGRAVQFASRHVIPEEICMELPPGC